MRGMWQRGRRGVESLTVRGEDDAGLRDLLHRCPLVETRHTGGWRESGNGIQAVMESSAMSSGESSVRGAHRRAEERSSSNAARYGCTDKALRADSSCSDIGMEDPQEDVYRTYFGAWTRGYGQFYLDLSRALRSAMDMVRELLHVVRIRR